MEVIVKYYKGKPKVFSHSYKENWKKTDEYCPFCGKQNLWVGSGDDYYLGCTYLCIDCESKHYLDHCGNADYDCYKQILNAIREE